MGHLCPAESKRLASPGGIRQRLLPSALRSILVEPDGTTEALKGLSKGSFHVGEAAGVALPRHRGAGRRPLWPRAPPVRAAAALGAARGAPGERHGTGGGAGAGGGGPADRRVQHGAARVEEAAERVVEQDRQWFIAYNVYVYIELYIYICLSIYLSIYLLLSNSGRLDP